MKPIHVALAVLIAAVWGFNFIAIKFGVTAAPPFFLTGARFLLAAIPAVFFVAKPREHFGWVMAFGLVLGVGQFGFLFLAVRMGLPVGLTSLVMQTQAFFTMFFAWALMGEAPVARQTWGAVIAFVGIAVIAYARWSGPDAVPLLLCLAAAAGWAMANIISKKARPANTLSFVIWSSLAVPVPMFALSYIFEDHAQSWAIITHPTLQVVLSLLYLAFLSTLFGYAAWNHLFNHYSAATIAPFSLLIPIFGILGGAVVFGERFDIYAIVGGALIILGLIYSNYGPSFSKKKAET